MARREEAELDTFKIFDVSEGSWEIASVTSAALLFEPSIKLRSFGITVGSVGSSSIFE